MKNYILYILILSFSFSYSQKKKNGNIYVEHPAIDIINKLYSAINEQDYELMDELISDDYKGVNGGQMNKDAEPQTKSEFINQVKGNFTNARYVSVKQYENSYPHEISSGEQQRVAIARSLVNNPDLILADEMTGNLDEDTANNIFKFFINFIEQNKKTLVYVTHNKTYSLLADEIYYFKNKKIHLKNE